MNAITLEKCNPKTRTQTTDSKQLNLLEIILFKHQFGLFQKNRLHFLHRKPQFSFGVNAQ